MSILSHCESDLLEELVDDVELLGLLGQLSAYVAADKDALEIHPLALHDDPDLDDLADERERLLPRLHGVEEGSDEARGGHALQAHRVVVQRLHDVVDAAEHEAAILCALDILAHLELELLPRLDDLLDALLDLQLLAGRRDDVLYDLVEAMQLHVEQIGERERVRIHVELAGGLLHQLAPVAFAQRLVLQVAHERQRLLERLHLVLESARHSQRAHVFGHLLERLDVVVDAVDEQLDVEVAPQRLGPLLARLLLVLVETVELLEAAHLLLHVAERRVVRYGQIEETLGVGQLLLVRLEFGQLVAIGLEQLDAAFQVVADGAGTALRETLGKRLHADAEAGDVVLGDLGEALLDVGEADVAVLGLEEEVEPGGLDALQNGALLAAHLHVVHGERAIALLQVVDGLLDSVGHRLDVRYDLEHELQVLQRVRLVLQVGIELLLNAKIK